MRHSYPESPPRVEYTLTEKGRGLLPIIHAMSQFGHEWLFCDHDHTDEPRSRRERSRRFLGGFDESRGVSPRWATSAGVLSSPP